MSDMISITIKGVEHVLSPTEAHRVVTDLSVKIKEVEQVRRHALLQPIQLDERGRFNKLMLREFFEPVYPEARQCNRAGKLFNKLCWISKSVRGSITVTHVECGQSFSVMCPLTNKFHGTDDATGTAYWIDASSVLRHPLILNGYVRNVGEAMIKDYELLLSHIEL